MKQINQKIFNDKEGVIYKKSPNIDNPSLRIYKPIKNLDFQNHLTKNPILIQLQKDRKYSIDELTNKIIHGDAHKTLVKIPSDTIQLVVTSPPYWNVVDYGFEGQYGRSSYEEYLEELLKVWKECERVLVPNGKLCIQTPIMPISKNIINEQHTRHIKNINNDIEYTILNATPLKRFSLYIWKKQTTEKMFGSYPYPPNLYEQNIIEFINVFVKDGEPKKLSKEVKEHSKLTVKEWMELTNQIWTIISNDIKREQHPAPFPEELSSRLIAMYSFKKVEDNLYDGDIVLDPFCGIGTTCISAKRFGRNYIGIDLSEDFCLKSSKDLQYSIANSGRINIREKNRQGFFL